MKLAIGLVIKGGKQFIDQWIECAERIGNIILVVDNNADGEAKQKLINHSKVKQYHIQKNMGRNQSRDYQKILEMAREEECTWVLNLDIDEVIPNFDVRELYMYLLNITDVSISFPLFEMRNDSNHYVMVRAIDGSLKQARMCHKCYKVLSHFKFDEKDIHGSAIPHNCTPGDMVSIPIKHFGHYTKELRAEKRAQYEKSTKYKDEMESTNTWMEDDDSKVVIKKFEGMTE